MSMRVSVTGLNAAQTELSTIANNIANASTTGFKASRVQFADLFAGDASRATPGSGVRVESVTQLFKQGDLEVTGNNLDVAINGRGFFATRSADGRIDYTRAGNFRLNTTGDVVNESGARALFFAPNGNGGFNETVGGLVPIKGNVPLVVTTQRVTSIAVGQDPAGPPPTTTKTLQIGGGAPITLNPRTEDQASARAAALATDINARNIPGLRAFVDPIDNTRVSVEYTGAAALNLSNISAAAQGPIAPVSSVESFALTRFEIDSSGIARATYANGSTAELGKLALANFTSPTELAPQGNNSWRPTLQSGEPTFGAAGQGDRGQVQSGVLEGSNVDIAEQLVHMITAQRNFQANAKSITTFDAIAQAIINIR